MYVRTYARAEGWKVAQGGGRKSFSLSRLCLRGCVCGAVETGDGDEGRGAGDWEDVGKEESVEWRGRINSRGRKSSPHLASRLWRESCNAKGLDLHPSLVVMIDCRKR